MSAIHSWTPQLEALSGYVSRLIAADLDRARFRQVRPQVAKLLGDRAKAATVNQSHALISTPLWLSGGAGRRANRDRVDTFLPHAARWQWLMALLAAVFLLGGCRPGESEDAAKPAAAKPASVAPKAVLVELARVERGRIEELLERSAPLEAEAQVQVRARTQNPAIELLVEEGDKVAEGQVLLRLESDRQKTDYEQSLSQLEETRIRFKREESLYEQQLISESVYLDAQFANRQAELRTANAKRELEFTEVRAPIKGTITSRTVKVGDQVGPGYPIFEIIDLDSTVAVINVPEQYLPKLKPDMEARLRSSTLGDRVFAGYVKRISPIVEARAGTIKVVVGVKELGPLRPGMWVDVELVLDSKQDALLLPKRAIVYDNDQTFAYKVYTDTNQVMRARREKAVAVNADKEHVEPAAGFAEGEIIVVAGHSGLKDETPIRQLEKEDPPARQTPIDLARVGTNAIQNAKGETTPGARSSTSDASP